MAEKKATKKPTKKAENESIFKDLAIDCDTCIHLKVLLERFAEIPEDKRASLISRIEREAAGAILTEQAVEDERKKLLKFFNKVKDPRKKKLIARKIDEVAFQAVMIREAREDLISNGLQAEVVNGSQHYPKENPSVGIYDKNCRAYQSNIDKLIEYLPPQEEKAKSALAALRDEL
jgi:hypothetical protein